MACLLRNLSISALLAGLIAGAAGTPETTVEGVLIDKECSVKAETRVVMAQTGSFRSMKQATGRPRHFSKSPRKRRTSELKLPGRFKET